MRGIASRAAAKAVALAAIFAFALCVFVAAGSTQDAYADEGMWTNNHSRYWKDGDIPVTDCIYYVKEEKSWYAFDEDGYTRKGWIKVEGDPTAYYYGDPKNYGKLKLGWQKIGGYWYYFAKDKGYSEDSGKYYYAGMMYDHGVAKVNGKWYYFGKSDSGSKWGKLQYGWIGVTNDDGDKVWYYADPNKDGQLALGWKKVGGKWYYFEPSNPGAYCGGTWYPFGQMHYDGIENIKGHDYYFAKGGALKSGWIKEPWTSAVAEDGSYQKGNDWYYADPNNGSRLVSGWKKIGGYWYWFASDYEMRDNCTWTVGGKLYVFQRSGKLASKAGWYNLYEEYFYTDGSDSQTVPYWVYSNKYGIATTGWKKISGYWYYFDADGYMQHDKEVNDSKGTCRLGSNGKMLVSKWFYADYNGEMYYFDASGHMVKGGKITIDGESYSFDDEGHYIP